MRSEDGATRRLGWEALVSAYWKPVYKHLRLRWRADAESARDMTQEFFARALEKSFFDEFDPERARFRTYLRVCVDGFAGGSAQHYPDEGSCREENRGVVLRPHDGGDGQERGSLSAPTATSRAPPRTLPGRVPLPPPGRR